MSKARAKPRSGPVQLDKIVAHLAAAQSGLAKLAEQGNPYVHDAQLFVTQAGSSIDKFVLSLTPEGSTPVPGGQDD